MKRLYISRLFVGLLVFLLVFAQPLFVYAAIVTNSNAFMVNPDYLIGTGSNADPYGLMTLELDDNDYMTMSPRSSVGTVTNTVDYVRFSISLTNGTYTNYVTHYLKPVNGRFEIPSFSMPEIYSGYWINRIFIYIQDDGSLNSLPRPSGNYLFSLDLSSDFSYALDRAPLWVSAYKYENSVFDEVRHSFDNYAFSSGDVYIPATPFNIKSGYYLNRIDINIKQVTNLQYFSGSFAMNFTPTSQEGIELSGPDVSSSELYEDSVSGSLSDISSSIGDMSESLDSAAENLEYISTSQNLIIQGIDNVIMHISDQLYAFWDQLYNLIHEPTYARLEQILLALKAIANNSDISAVVDTIEETTQQQISNDNSNTSKVESAVEKHGNFIIEGLKGLFIPSDEYFKSYFDDLYTYFSDRFGFLSFPIDLLVRLVDLFVNSSDKDCILTLPEFEISGEKLITEASFNLTEFLENDFAILLSSIRLVTSIGLIMAFVNLCQDKWNEVMRN